jgi:ADP-heptose:LPS heptosyltransferase
MERGNRYLKLTDRYLGIPLLYFLRLFRKKNRTVPPIINRIAIVKGAAIGDTVLLSAIVQDIRCAYPVSELVFFCGKTCVDIAKLIPGIDQVVFIPTTKPHVAVQLLRSYGKFDIVIDAGPWTRLEAILTCLTPGAFKIGFNSLKQYRHMCYDYAAIHAADRHELANNRALLAPFVSSTNSRPVLSFPEVRVGVLLERLGLAESSSFWVLHPWSGGYKGEYKEWKADYWVTVAKWLTNKGFQVVFSGAKANVAATDELVSQCRSQHIAVSTIAGQTSLVELLTLIQASVGVISVNTGVLHIAATTDKPVVALNGPVPTLRWGAISEKAVNIDCKPPLKGYIHLGFEYPENPPDCMGSIEPEDVIEAVKTMLNPTTA